MDESTTTTSTGLQDYYNMIKAEHEANNAWSAEQAQKAMDYQTQMSNTAHQREVADLKAAGLNPVLSAGGSGATSGSGMAAQRGDENVTALYGLTKTALDATIKQASAMNNIARAYGYGSGSRSSSVSGSSVDDALLSVLADVGYRMFGIKQDSTKALYNSLGLGSVTDIFKSGWDWLKNNAGIHSETSYSKDDSFSNVKKPFSSSSSGFSSHSGKIDPIKSFPDRNYVFSNSAKKIANTIYSSVRDKFNKVLKKK